MSSTGPSDHPKQIGPYHIVQVIGEGGMGIVFDAEQREPVRRRVALKMLKVGMDTKEVVARFEAERQALALMDHASIAKVFDAGATEEGRPYFVMERVRGIHLDDYCDEHLLTVRERIELFIAICDAVQHAHQKGVMHRDLKPSNVIVADAGGVPIPKVIDFGIAKATGQRLTDRTAVTTYGQTVGTLNYMSPEQAEMDGLDVDTRTDIYSLGIMLFELLVGRVPVDLSQVGTPVFLASLIQRDKSLPTALQVLRSLDPDRRERVAKARSTSRSALEREVAGDLRWILLKATEKDRTRRYQSASELVQDLQRYLNDEPVSARAPSATYRLRKFVRRHRTGAAVAVAGILAILFGSVAATVGMVRAQRAEAAAALEAETAVRVSEFLTDLFEVSDPSIARGGSVTARELLDSGAVRVRSELADQPALQARLMTVIGDVYRSLGAYEQGQPLLEEALALYQSEVDAPLEAARTKNKLAYLLVHAADYERAQALALEARETFREELGEGSSPAAEALNHYAFSRLRADDDPAGLAELLTAALPAQRARLGPRSEGVGNTMDHLCWANLRAGDEVAADSMCYATLELRRDILGWDHPTVGYTLTRVAGLRSGQGRHREALAHYEEALDIADKLYEGVHPEVAYPLEGIAGQYRRLGEPERALPFAERALAVRRQVLQPDNPEIARSLTLLGLIYSELDRLDQSMAVNREAVEIQERAFGPDSPRLIIPLNNLAVQQEQIGALAEAEATMGRAQALVERHRDELDLVRLVVTLNYAEILAARGRIEDAERRATVAYEGFVESVGEQHWRTAFARAVLGHTLGLSGRHEAAETALTESWGVLQESQPRGSEQRRDAARYLVELYERIGQASAAARWRDTLNAEEGAGAQP